jgi:hypothetical protein
MGAEQAMQFTAEQEGKMGEGTEGPVADQNVAFFQFGMNVGDLGHVVGSKRRCQYLKEEARAGVKKGQQVRHREATARPLACGLAEFSLQFGSIGHAEARAVYMEGAMPAPKTIVPRRGPERSRDALQQRLQDAQRQASAGSTIGGFGENPIGEVSEPGNGKVAVEDLDDEELDGGNRIQDAPAKVVASIAANGGDLCGIEDSGNISLDAPQSGVKVCKHP